VRAPGLVSSFPVGPPVKRRGGALSSMNFPDTDAAAGTAELAHRNRTARAKSGAAAASSTVGAIASRSRLAVERRITPPELPGAPRADMEGSPRSLPPAQHGTG
jgi:hypothetical protein